jgi:hypothetical protein
MLLYKRILTPAREAPDGETPEHLRVIKTEKAGTIVLYESHDHGTVCIAHSMYDPDALITHAAQVSADAVRSLAQDLKTLTRFWP